MVQKLRILSNIIERLNKLDEPVSGNIYGVVCKDSLIVLTYTLNIPNEEETNSNIELQSCMPAEIDFCGILCIDQEKPDISKMFKDIDVTDNPILLEYSTKEKNIEAYFYIHQMLKGITDVEIINEADVLQHFSYVRVHGDITLVAERENILNTLDEMKKNIASGKIGFHFSHCNTYIMGADIDDYSSTTKSIKDLDFGKSSKKSYLRNNPQIMSAITANTLLKISRNKDSEGKKYAPVIRHIKKSCEYFTFILKLDALSFIHNDIQENRLYEILVESVCRNLRLIRKSLETQIKDELFPIQLPKLYHFKPLELGHPLTMVYTAKSSDDKFFQQREFMHKVFNLGMLKPCFRIGNIVKFESDFNDNEPLINPHEAIPQAKASNGKVSLVSGLYAYHHYMQDNFNDNGWGCAYRSLQTIVSWFRLQGYTDKPVPTHHEIQKCLVDISDKPSSFFLSKEWIGSTEVSFVLETLFGVESKILTASTGEDMAGLVPDLAYHFETQGTPVMIGGGVLAHTILGVSYTEESDNDVKFLILDPHYTGPEHINTIINKGWCSWKAKDFWRKDGFYNMCLPQRPKLLII